MGDAPAAEAPARRQRVAKATAQTVDRFGRAYNPRVHVAPDKIDAEGYLVVRRRDETRKPMGTTLEMKDTLDLHREEGYEYRWVNRKAGRIAKFEAADWEPVMDKAGGQVSLVVNPRSGMSSGAADAVLMRKPKEWFDADSAAKTEATRVDFKAKTAVQPGAEKFYSGLTQERDPRVQ